MSYSTNYYKLLLIVTIITLVTISETHSKCNEIRVRRNFTSLSASEWQHYVQVFNEMHHRGLFEPFADLHARGAILVHNSSQFLLWHRYFLYDFENKMRSINPNLTVPYWDAAADFRAPHRAAVFNSSAFGGNGSPNNNFCIFDGFMANWTVGPPPKRCLKRHFAGPSENTIFPWSSPLFITSLIQSSKNYSDFREKLEFTFHNEVHHNVGGDFGDHSGPLDSLFWLHHANIDRIYAKWQKSNAHYLNSIDGYQKIANGSTIEISLDYKISDFDIRVGDILKILEEPLCYSYEESTGQRSEFTSLAEARIRELIPESLLKKYFPKFYAGQA